MKILVQILLVVLFTFIGQYFLPWWGIFLSTGVVGLLISNKGYQTFIAGFIAISGLWFAQIYAIDLANESILSAKIAAIFTLNSSLQLMLVTSLIGGICGGFGALSGKYLMAVFTKKKEHHTVYT